MPFLNPVEGGALIAAQVRADYAKTYEPMVKTVDEDLSPAMEMGVSAKTITETFGYPESPGDIRRKPRGTDVATEGFRSISYTATNYEWAIGCEWYYLDRMTDQTGYLVQQARNTGTKAALLKERLFYQLLLNTTDPDLLPTISNAPDGNAIFLGTSRFGDSNGNILSGAGVTTGNFQTDYFDALEKFMGFQDTKGQPLIPAGLIAQGATIYAGVHNSKALKEAFKQGITHSVVSSTGAGVSNIILESGDKVKLVFTPRIASTNDDWFIVLNGIETKPFGHMELMPLTPTEYSRQTGSDKSRSSGVEGVQWETVGGVVVNLPFGIIQVDN